MNYHHSLLIKKTEYGAVGSIDIEDTNESSSSPQVSLTSILIICLVVLISDTARGVFFPTLWLYVQSLGGNKSSQGLCVAAFSIGRIISSPIFGYWSQYSNFRVVLLTSNFIIILGCLLYASTTSIQMLVCSQFILGVGAGSLGVTRSFIAENSKVSERTVYLANLTAFQYAGFTVTPILGAILASLGYQHRSKINNWFEINQFTAPALGYGAITLICCILLITSFKEFERRVAPSPRPPPDDPSSSDETQEGSVFSLSMVDKAILGGCLLNIVTKGTIGVFETIGSEFAISHFHWSSSWTGYTFASMGAMGVLSLLLFQIFTRYASDVDLVLFGMMTMALACLLMLGPFTRHQISLEFLFAIFLMYSVGYPIGHTALLGMFSKIVKSGPQGALLGWFGSAGSLARVVFPLVTGIVVQSTQDDVSLFAAFGILLVLSLGVLVHFRNLFIEITERPKI